MRKHNTLLLFVFLLVDANQTKWHLHRNHLVSVPDLRNAALPPQRVPNSSSAEGGPALKPACPLARKITLGVVWLGFSAAAQALVGFGWKGTSNSMSAEDSVLLLQGAGRDMKASAARSSFHLPSSVAGGRARRAQRWGSEGGEEDTEEESRESLCLGHARSKKGSQQTETRVCSARFTPHSLKQYDAMLKTPDWHRKY